MLNIFFLMRCAIGALWLFAASLISMLLLPFRWKDPSAGAVFGRLLGFLGQPITGVSTHLINQKTLYLNQPCVYLANHQSNFDIFIFGPIYPWRTALIGKKELLRIPLFGLFYYGSGNILIDRKNRKHSLAGLESAREAIEKRGVSVWIFPEGTRNRGSAHMLPFKKGAFHLAIAAQVPIVPIVQQHVLSYFDLKRLKFKTGPVTVRVLDPISTTGMKMADVPKLMADVRAKMDAAMAHPEMKAPKTEHHHTIRT